MNMFVDEADLATRKVGRARSESGIPHQHRFSAERLSRRTAGQEGCRGDH